MDRFGLEVLRRNGLDVEVWDFTAIINPFRAAYQPPDRSDFNKYRIFSAKKEARLAIKELPRGSFVVCLIGYECRSYVIYRALSRYSIPYGLYAYNYPSFDIKKKSGIKRLFNITPEKLGTYILNAIPLKYLGIRPASIVQVLGGAFTVPRFFMGDETKILWSHIFDYEIYLRVMRQSIPQNNKMVVFLDQYFPFHPDDAVGSHIITAEEYYPRLCRFFDYLEKTYGVSVVIAAHPRSQYEGKENLYGCRPILRGRTAELVRASRVVMMHDSASVNYAVLFKKPIIFITTDLLQEARMGVTEYMAGLFDKKVFNIDQSALLDWPSEIAVNEHLYTEYLNRYIKKKGTDDTPTWQIFADYIKQNEIGGKKKRG